MRLFPGQPNTGDKAHRLRMEVETGAMNALATNGGSGEAQDLFCAAKILTALDPYPFIHPVVNTSGLGSGVASEIGLSGLAVLGEADFPGLDASRFWTTYIDVFNQVQVAPRYF